MIHHTVNKTTVTVGQATATCILKTVPETTSLHGEKPHPIVTWELVYPRYIHSELMTHRVFSRNASSSRATPCTVTCNEVIDDPVFFDFVGKNQRGMTAAAPLSIEELAEFRAEWERLGQKVAEKVLEWKAKYNIHKQTINRALEPWLRIRTLVTATELENFFNLRLAPDAQPEIQSLARAMQKSMQLAETNVSDWHIPYAEYFAHKGYSDGELTIKSVASCARVSVMRNDGKVTSLEEDSKFYNFLLEHKHMSPFEHVAAAQPIGLTLENLVGWRSLRALLEGKPLAVVKSEDRSE